MSYGYARAVARTQTMVQLSDDLIVELDRVAAERGVSRSALIRGALADYLAAVRAADVGRQIVAGYARIPPSTPDSWGEPTGLGEAGERDVLARLELEEDDAGQEPW